MKDVLEIQSKARNCLNKTNNYLKEKTITSKKGWGLQQFLDEITSESKYIGVYGTSCGVSALIATNENYDSDFIKNYVLWLSNNQEINGGWTISTFKGKDVLTTSSCYVLNALVLAGEDYSNNSITEGLNWLRKTRNSDYGWGLYENDNQSKTTPTAHVINTMAKFPDLKVLPTFYESVNWLIKSRNKDNGWGQNCYKDSPSTIAHTSLAITALINSGYSIYSPIIQESLSYLLKNIDKNKLQTEDEVFSVVHSDENLTTTHYHLPTKSLVINALLLCEVDCMNEKILNLIDEIILEQNIDGYWLDNSTKEKIPIWSTMYAVFSLKEFITRVEKIRNTVIIRQELITVTKRLDKAEKELESITSRYKQEKNDIANSMSLEKFSNLKASKMAKRLFFFITLACFSIWIGFIYITRIYSWDKVEPYFSILTVPIIFIAVIFLWFLFTGKELSLNPKKIHNSIKQYYKNKFLELYNKDEKN